MELYDSLIKKAYTELEGHTIRKLDILPSFEESPSKSFILPSESSHELGSSPNESSYFLSFTTGDLVKEDEILLIGKDIMELPTECSFVHLSFILMDDEGLDSSQKLYRAIRNVEYTRYRNNPKGYSIRINTNLIRESIRVSKDLDKPSFSVIGSSFLSHFKEEKSVKAVKQVFITDPSFDYKSIADLAKLNEGITVALDSIMKNMLMDCNTCSFKNICDQVEGMREIHKKEKNKM